MGISRTADIVTGLSLERGSPAVAILLGRASGGYPDAQASAAKPPLCFDDLFVPLSLPIRGRVGDSPSDFTPNKGQQATAMACDIAGTTSWHEMAGKAFDFNNGAVLWRDKKADRIFGVPEPKPPEILGLAVISSQSWNTILGIGSHGIAQPRDEAVAIVTAAVCDAQEQGMASDDDLVRYRSLSMVNLSQSGQWTLTNGTTVELPDLSRSLGDMDGLAVSGTLRRYLRRVFEAKAWTQKTLEGIYDLEAMKRGLEYSNRLLLPSSHGSQHDNCLEVVSVATSAIEQAANFSLARFEENGDEELQELDHITYMLQRLHDDILARREAILKMQASERPMP